MITREADVIASFRIECEIVVSSLSSSPSELRPTARLKSPSLPTKKTNPRSAPVMRNVASTSVTRTSSRAPRLFSLRATSRKNASFSRSEASFSTWSPEIWLNNSRAELVVWLVVPNWKTANVRSLLLPNCKRSLLTSLCRFTRDPLTNVPCLLPRSSR